MAGDRLRCDLVFDAERRLLSKAIKIALHAVALDATGCARVASVFVPLQGLLY
jgi:hypothetical protein